MASVQYNTSFVGKFSGSQTGGGSGYWEVSGNFTDESGAYDSSNVMVGDVLYVSDSGVGYFLEVTTIISAAPPAVTFRVSNVGITGIVAVPTALMAIYRPTAGYSLVPYVSGVTFPDQQTYQNYFVKKIEDALDGLSGGSAISTYDVTISGGNAGGKLTVKATGAGVTAAFASNRLTITVPTGVTLLSAHWLVVSADVQASADGGGTTSWVQVRFTGAGLNFNDSIGNIRVPLIQKTSIPTSGALTVSNAATIDVDNNPAASVIGVAESGTNITLRFGGLSVGSQGYMLTITDI